MYEMDQNGHVKGEGGGAQGHVSVEFPAAFNRVSYSVAEFPTV
jgi:hypothetical protein